MATRALEPAKQVEHMAILCDQRDRQSCSCAAAAEATARNALQTASDAQDTANATVREERRTRPDSATRDQTA